MIFGRISFIQKELLVNVKREMTYVYFQYSCFVTPLCQDTLNTGWQIVTFREIFLFAVFYFSMEYFFKKSSLREKIYLQQYMITSFNV